MATVKQVKHIDVIKRTQKGVTEAVLGVAEQGVSIAALRVTTDTADIKQHLSASNTSKTSAIFGSSVEYAPFVEFGSSPHAAPISALQGWADRHGIPVGAVWMSIKKKGTPEQPFLRPAADKLKSTGSRIFAKILKGVLNHG